MRKKPLRIKHESVIWNCRSKGWNAAWLTPEKLVRSHQSRSRGRPLKVPTSVYSAPIHMATQSTRLQLLRFSKILSCCVLASFSYWAPTWIVLVFCRSILRWATCLSWSTPTKMMLPAAMIFLIAFRRQSILNVQSYTWKVITRRASKNGLSMQCFVMDKTERSCGGSWGQKLCCIWTKETYDTFPRQIL